MSDIEPKLTKLELVLRESNAPILQFLNPGLQNDEIIIFFSQNDIPIHSNLLSLYRWHNGLDSIYGRLIDLVSFLPSGAFPNLNEMASLKADFMSYDYFEVTNREDYVPILSGGEDDMHLLRVSTGEIYYSSPRIQVYCEPMFHSLTSMLDFTLKCYDDGVLSIDPIKGLVTSESYWEINGDYGT